MSNLVAPSSDRIKASIAKASHIEWMKYTWRRNDPFIVGKHTEIVCNAIDRAMENYRNGVSTHLMIKLPFRHGKTDMVGRYLPPRFIGEFPDAEVMFATYASALSLTVSKFSRDIIKSDRYREAYHEIELKHDDKSVAEWGIEGHLGKMYSFGMDGGATGKGGNLIVVDDSLKNREEAESQVIRDKRWNGLTNDIFTRLAPVYIFIIMGTPWHIDDIYGRMDDHMKTNPNFPRFEEIKISYKNEDGSYLFPERFSDDWYKNQEAVLGEYGTSGLLACDPMSRSGHIIKTSNINIIEADDIPGDVRFIRVWDLASTEDKLLKDDPDYTVGMLIGVRWEKALERGLEPIPYLYIKDVKRFREEAPERNNRIKQTAMIDGASVQIFTESVGGYKDTFTLLWNVLKGIRTVQKITPHKDKMARVEPVLPIFDAGNVSVIRADWNNDLIRELSLFPSTKHDDQVDCVSMAWERLRYMATSVRAESITMGVKSG